MACFGTGIAKSLPPFFIFVALPFLDWVFGEEHDQEPRVPASSWSYGIILHVAAALHMAAMLHTIYCSALPGMSATQMVQLSVNQGLCSCVAVNTAHELLHLRRKASRFLADALLASCCYLHWPYSHKAHHAQVRLLLQILQRTQLA